MQRVTPESFEAGRPPLVLPVVAHDVVSGSAICARDLGQELVRRMTTVQGGDARLLDRYRAIEGADVAPRFEHVRGRQMPVAARGCLIVIQAQMRLERYASQRCFEIEIGRCVVYRIAAD